MTYTGHRPPLKQYDINRSLFHTPSHRHSQENMSFLPLKSTHNLTQQPSLDIISSFGDVSVDDSTLTTFTESTVEEVALSEIAKKAPDNLRDFIYSGASEELKRHYTLIQESVSRKG